MDFDLRVKVGTRERPCERSKHRFHDIFAASVSSGCVLWIRVDSMRSATTRDTSRRFNCLCLSNLALLDLSPEGALSLYVRRKSFLVSDSPQIVSSAPGRQNMVSMKRRRGRGRGRRTLKKTRDVKRKAPESVRAGPPLQDDFCGWQAASASLFLPLLRFLLSSRLCGTARTRRIMTSSRHDLFDRMLSTLKLPCPALEDLCLARVSR